MSYDPLSIVGQIEAATRTYPNDSPSDRTAKSPRVSNQAVILDMLRFDPDEQFATADICRELRKVGAKVNTRYVTILLTEMAEDLKIIMIPGAPRIPTKWQHRKPKVSNARIIDSQAVPTRSVGRGYPRAA